MGILPASDDPSVAVDALMGGMNEQNDANQAKDMDAGLFESVPITTAYPLVSAPQATPINDAIDAIFATSGTVFSSKDFEEKLIQFAVSEVASSGRIPPDEAIKAKAKEISGLEVWQAETTPADDPTLLAGFKQLVIDKVKAVLGAHEDRPANPFPQYQHSQTKQSLASVLSPSVPTPDRGMDAIDPGLLPALDPATRSKAETQISPPTPIVQVAISEKRLEEIIGEMGRGGG